MEKKITLLLTMLLVLGAGNSWATVVTTVSDVDTWKSFVASVKAGDDYSSTTVTLSADITLPANASDFANIYEVGTSTNPFKGTFDGQGYTITYTKTGLLENYQALFRYVNGATIKNLKTSGELSSSAVHVAGIVGNAAGAVTLDNCSCDMTLTSSNSSDCRIGGLVARCADSGASLTISNCMFNGSISAGQSGRAVGFVGWCNTTNTITINSCFLNPTSVTNGGRRFSAQETGTTISNSWFIHDIGFSSNTGGSEATDDKLLSGEVAYDLQNNQATQYWGQGNLNKSNIDAYPSLTSDSKKKVVKTKISGMSTQPYVNPGGAVPNPVRFGLTGFKLTTEDANTLETMPAEGGTFVYGTTELLTTKKMYCVTLPAEAMTLILPFDAELPSGITAYDITYTSGDKVTASPVTKITANKPVLINGTKGTLYKFSTTSDASYSASTGTNGALTGVFVDQGGSGYNPISYVPANSYVLQDQENGLKFYKVTEANKIKITSFRAYLSVPSSARSIDIDYGDGTTGISEMKTSDNSSAPIYNLSGQRVGAGYKGIVIQNGKKFVVK